MTRMNGIFGRLLKLEQAAPDPDDGRYMRERLARAKERAETSLTDEERTYRATTDYAAEQEEHRQRWNSHLPRGSRMRR